ncbi:MAG: hypothetical protein QOH61_835 [Chloroflexota bacterium]|jgi:hypothetical protein|nr:hypothetical protein [Chloroflexota bacterium]
MYRSLRSPSAGTGKPAQAVDRHVIEEYKHRAQTVTCVCGWHGSTAAAATERSEWQTHVAQYRTKSR